MAYDKTTDMQTLTVSAAIAQCQANFVALKDEAMSIAGIYTFAASPIVPTPTTDMQASTKKYVDDTAVALTGNQTVAGIKTFSSSPIVPAPTTDLQVSTKKYVDDTVDTHAAAITKASLGIDCGVAGATTIGATVAFNFAFSVAPKVVLGDGVAHTGDHQYTWVTNITTTNFKLWSYSWDLATVNWIAIGTV